MASETRLPEPLSLEGNIAEDWRRFHQEFEIYMISTEKTEKKDEVKVALLLRCGGSELVDIFNTLPISEEEKKKYKDLVKGLKNHFEPKKYVTYERYMFNIRAQEEGESIDTFVTDLRKKAKNCNYGQLHDELVRDRIICGISDEILRGRLLRMDDPSLEEVINQCRTHEISEEHKRKFNATIQSDVKLVSTYSSNKSRQYRTSSQNRKDKVSPGSHTDVKSCKYCGYSHPFGRRFCPAVDQECHRCRRRGHFKTVCTSYGNQQQRSRGKGVRTMAVIEDDSFGSEEYVEKSWISDCFEEF